MSIISQVGRKSFKTRLLVCSIVLSLCAGAVTMIYPFLLMIAGSTKSAFDVSENAIIPSFLTDDTALYRKTMEAFFNEYSEALQSTYDTHEGDFKRLTLPESVRHGLVESWEAFLEEKSYPFYYYGLSFVHVVNSRMATPENFRRFKRILQARYRGSLEDLNRDLGTEFVSWSSFVKRADFFLSRRMMPAVDNNFNQKYWKFKAEQPLFMRYYFSPEGFFKTVYLRAAYTRDISAYNASHGTDYDSWDEVVLTRRYPGDKQLYTDRQRKDWEEYVRSILNLLWIRVDKAAAPLYREFLETRYGDIAALNDAYGTEYDAFAEVPLVERPPFSGDAFIDWSSFIQGWTDPHTGRHFQAPTATLEIHSVGFDFQDWLEAKYGDIGAVNRELGTEFSRWHEIAPPQQEFHFRYFDSNKSALRREFCKRNFIAVADYILLHGRGIWNTFVYCSLAILCALTINPLAAYALSRYQPPSAYKMLLFLMLTMAFPPMVTQIPIFLLLREFGLLNTYAALILPAMANGYMIFLLKGFFDSLPRELYETAMIDGAGECRIFLQITMSLSKPILAVIALQTFQLAYSNFMMALLLCQDERMWTLMPWLYQLQTRGSQGVVFASLLIAAIPTFLVFVFCQNIIMRGIVVPVEK